MAILTKEQLQDFVAETIQNTPITDIHTHLYAESFGDLLLWGIDELLTYHYLIAETLRYYPEMPYEEYWKMTKSAQADFIWKTLFIDHSPISEACRGVITVLHRLGLDVATTRCSVVTGRTSVR